MARRPATGIIWHEALHGLVGHPAVELWEIEPQTVWAHDPAGRSSYVAPIEAFRSLRDAFGGACVVHGVGFPVGGSGESGPQYEATFRASVDALNAPWVSEHLAFNVSRRAAETFNTSFLHAPLCTERGVAAAAARVRRFAAITDRPAAIENPVSYLSPQPWEMTDGQFLASVAEQADCHLLLDLHNAWCNHINGRQDLHAFLDEIPLDRVIEIHVAGGLDLDGFWLDGHNDGPPAAVLEALAPLVPRCPNLEAVVFEILPWHVDRTGLPRVESFLRAIHAALDAPPSRPRKAPAFVRRRTAGCPSTAPSPEEWEDAVGWLGLGRRDDGELSRHLEQDPGMAVLRRLVWQFRAGRLAAAFPSTISLLRAAHGPDGSRAVVSEFLDATLPELFPSQVPRQFVEFLASSGEVTRTMSQAALAEWAERRLPEGEPVGPPPALVTPPSSTSSPPPCCESGRSAQSYSIASHVGTPSTGSFGEATR